MEKKTAGHTIYSRIRRVSVLGILVAMVLATGAGLALSLVQEHRMRDDTLTAAVQAVSHTLNIVGDGREEATYRYVDRTVQGLAGIDLFVLYDENGVPLYFYDIVAGTGDPSALQPLGDGLRRQLADELAARGPAALYAELQAADPEAAAAIHPNNHLRVLRALEHYRATGRRLSEQKAASLPPERPYRALVLGLDFPAREQLYRRIDARVDRMLEQGLLEEARMVYDRRASCRTAAQAIGYKEFFPYFAGEDSLAHCTEQLKQASRRYAKRQLTWFRHMDGVVWLDAGAPDLAAQALRLAEAFLQKG